jgi:NTP pyrophosphatase (non-canonical NTP hydrolase)
MADWRDEARHIHETVVKSWEPYSAEDLRFSTLALAGEVGEFANLVKKGWRGDDLAELADPRVWAGELADIRIYLELVALCCGVDLERACAAKIGELYERWPEAKS